MSRITLPFMYFVAGMLCMFLISLGSHTSTFAQGKTPARGPSFGFARVGRAGIPVVPPIRSHFTNFSSTGGTLFQVDGADCTRCSFSGGATLLYDGGNFRFKDFSFSGPIRYRLDGAAKNTVIFLAFLQSLARGKAPKRNTLKPPATQMASVSGLVRGSVGTTQ